MISGRTLAKGFATVTGARLLGLVLTLIQVKLAVNYLGPTAYGLLVTATLFVQSLGAWTELGVGAVVVRRVSGRGADLERMIGLSMAISCVIVAPLIAATVGGGYLLYGDQPTVFQGVIILSLGLALQTWATCYNPVAQVTGRFGRYAAADFLGRALSLALVAYVVSAGGAIHWFFFAQLMVPFGQLVAMTSLGRSVGRFRPIFAFREVGGLVKETLPLTYILLVGVLYYTIDGVLLSKLSSPEQTGAYGLAYKTIGNISVISTALVNVMAARLAADASVSDERLSKTLRAAVTAVLVVALPVACLVWPVSSDLVRFVGSPDMVPLSSGPMAVVAVAMAIGMISGLISQALIASFQQGVLTRLNTFNLVLNVGLNVLLIPRYGAIGAAVSLVVSEANGLIVVSSLLHKRGMRFVPWSALLRMAVAVGVTLGLEQAIGEAVPWWLRILLVGVAWVVALAAMRVVTRTEIAQLRESH